MIRKVICLAVLSCFVLSSPALSEEKSPGWLGFLDRVNSDEKKLKNSNIKIFDFEDWRVKCGPKTCLMFQRISWDDNKKPALTALVFSMPDNKKIPAKIRLLAPLGALLAPGMVLQLDDKQAFKSPFHRCLPEGCIVDVNVGAAFYEQLKKGDTLKASFRRADGKVGSVSISLKGFTKAFEALSIKTAQRKK